MSLSKLARASDTTPPDENSNDTGLDFDGHQYHIKRKNKDKSMLVFSIFIFFFASNCMQIIIFYIYFHK